MTTRARFEGKAEVTALHRDIFAVLEVLDTTEPLVLGDTRAFTFRARVRGTEGEAVLLARCNEQVQIVEITIFARPLPTLATLFAALPPRVSARAARTHTWRARGDPEPAAARGRAAHSGPLRPLVPVAHGVTASGFTATPAVPETQTDLTTGSSRSRT